jgi:hypothetical protein
MNSFRGGLGAKVDAIRILLVAYRKTGTTDLASLLRVDPAHADRYATAVRILESVEKKRKELGLE